ncbi:MAG: DNA polymerase III subunit beta [Planctomycetes bacterium]|nr:DNA polymerase III subunit beta [Planctomycetota bacterium]
MSVMVEKSCLKVRGDAKELAEAIGIAASVAPSKSPRPVLQNLLLDARDGVLEVTGTDLDVAIRVRIERVDMTSEGRVLVNAARFQQILRELVGEQVEIETDERAGCIISTGDSRFHVMGEEPDDFPELGAWKGDGVLQLPASALVEMIRRTHFAAHPEKTRYAMNGILIDLKDQRLRLVATDGKRLSMCERPATAEAVKAPVFVVVPTKAMQLLQRVVGSGEEHVEVSVEPAQVQFRTAHATVMARLIEGHFPPYEDVLPKSHDKKLQLPREGFLSALRRASLLATKDSQAVRFRFAREGLELTARVPEVGESRVQFPLDYPFDELTIGFNPAFFADVLKVLSTTEFVLQLKDTRSAAVVQEQDKDGGVFVYLVMPLNLGA